MGPTKPKPKPTARCHLPPKTACKTTVSLASGVSQTRESGGQETSSVPAPHHNLTLTSSSIVHFTTYAPSAREATPIVFSTRSIPNSVRPRNEVAFRLFSAP